MAGARSILTAPPYLTKGQQQMANARASRGKHIPAKNALKLQTTTAIVQNLIDRKKGLVTERDVHALVTVTGTPKDQLVQIIEDARTKFSGAAVEYVDMHKEATRAALDLGKGTLDADGALVGGDAKALDVATRAAQWAIEKAGHAGKRVIEKEQAVVGSGGTKILIGISLGGKNPTYDGDAIVAEIPETV